RRHSACGLSERHVPQCRITHENKYIYNVIVLNELANTVAANGPLVIAGSLRTIAFLSKDNASARAMELAPIAEP
ncbi:MAG: hypothetical protein SPF40_04525, partial [Prevotella sp.]|nr:hypothetical protein [Prevotella sp.]